MRPQRAVLRKRLLREHIEGGACQRALLQRGDNIGIDLQRAAAGIDQERAAGAAVAPELAEQRKVQETLGLAGLRQQADQDLGAGEKRIDAGRAMKRGDAGR